MTPEENVGVTSLFLEKHPEFRLDDLREFTPPFLHPLMDSKGLFRTYPEGVTAETNRMDGFFAARLTKG
jgi:16S rRNA C967 or C1407 C5-methylase (RsmB/RsmF family)